EAASPSWSAVEAALSIKEHKFPDGGAPAYDKVSLDGRLYIRVVVPLGLGGGHRGDGYFEGVYHVSDARLATVRHRLFSTVALVVAVVLGTTVFLVPVMVAVGRRLMSLSRQLVGANIETLEVLGNAIAKRDSDTGAHNYRVTIFAIRLAETVGLDSAAIRALIKGAFLHDVGKIAISDAILLKPGKLTSEEFEVMKQHVAHGFDIVQSASSLYAASDVVLFHHEKFDGSGYLKGLKGEEIPITARIFAIADVFDALISRRPYKEPMDFEPALAIIREGAGRHFDPALVAAFAAIARPLYDAFAGRDDGVAERTLEDLTDRYFAVG
ncbi:MAG: HD domain-containing phosphohydrolase, partial [Rhodospirillaceae bacterium]